MRVNINTISSISAISISVQSAEAMYICDSISLRYCRYRFDIINIDVKTLTDLVRFDIGDIGKIDIKYSQLKLCTYAT